MVPSGFLGKPHQSTKPIKIITWNINGAKTKIEKSHVQNFLLEYDIVALNEVKTPLRVCLPGYVPFKSVTKENANRGGTLVMVKNSLASLVYNVDTSTVDQVWFQLQCAPGITFCFGYVPPTDSPYYSHSLFASIQERIIESSNEFFIMGDLNARFGRRVREIPGRSEIPQAHEYTYPVIPDDVNNPNDNSYILAALCSDNNMLVLNNLKYGEKKSKAKRHTKRSYNGYQNWIRCWYHMA